MNKINLVVFSLILLTGCTYKPKMIRYYDQDCGVMSKHLVLEKGQLQVLARGEQCEDEDCARMALAHALGSAFSGPITAIIAGSIVVAGNTVYWLQRQMTCN